MGQHDPSLIDEATAFADDVADLLNSTVADDASIKAHVLEDRVVVAALDEDGGTIFIPLTCASSI